MYYSSRLRQRDALTSFVKNWTVWDPRERMKMDTRFRMRVYDILLNFIIFTPLIILHNQAANGMLDFMFLRQFPKFGAWLLLILGIGIEFLLCFFHRSLLRRTPKDQEIYPILASHTFIYILTFGNISHIRAVGDLYGIYIGEDWKSAVKAMTTGLAALVGLKAVKNLMSPPLTLTIDSHQHEEVFETRTVFGTEADLTPGSALDAFATVGIVHSFVNLYWSGWWSFLDVWCFPNSPGLSSLICIIAGYACCVVAIMLHGKVREISKYLQDSDYDAARIFIEDIYHIFAGTAVITAWRGFWFGFYVMGDNFPILYKGKDVTSVAAHVVSFALLALANVSTSLPVKGVDVDGAERDGHGVICGIDYFCDYFKDELDEEEQTKIKQLQKPIAMVTGNQKVVNGSPTDTTKTRQRSVKKKLDDDISAHTLNTANRKSGSFIEHSNNNAQKTKTK